MLNRYAILSPCYWDVADSSTDRAGMIPVPLDFSLLSTNLDLIDYGGFACSRKESHSRKR